MKRFFKKLFCNHAYESYDIFIGETPIKKEYFECTKCGKRLVQISLGNGSGWREVGAFKVK